MKRSKKITVFVILFFLIISLIIGGRYAMGLYFKAKFGKRMPPGVIVKIVEIKNFNQSLESYCTALPSKTASFKLKKNELLTPIDMGTEVKKGDVIAALQSKKITAPFNGVIGTRGISGTSLGSENTIMLTLDDTKKILCDLSIPEKFSSVLKRGLKIKAKFSAYKDKTYEGKIETVASRIDAQTRSILARAKINNENLEILPGSLLEIELLYLEKSNLGIPDTALLMEGNKTFVYKIIENNMTKKIEIKTGIRDQGNLEVISGLFQGDKIVAEGLSKVGPNMKIKPIIKSE
jgi:membrane fusion protein (multidrug efflux system)